MGDTDYKLPISISLPQSIVRQLDKKRGHLARSTYILVILENALGADAG
jgi:metal-responsive CopG/Arc/MetJ family transcriptional regulator